MSAIKTYVIMFVVNITQAHIDASLQTSLGTLRKSADGTKAVLKYIGAQPTVLAGLIEYTQAEILTEMDKAEWIPAE